MTDTDTTTDLVRLRALVDELDLLLSPGVTPFAATDANGNPGTVAAGELIESAWGNAVVSRVTKTGPASARPAAPAAGTRFFATDTKRESMWDGTGWIVMSEPQQLYTCTTNCNMGTGGIDAVYHRSDGWCDYAIRALLGTGFGVAVNPVFSLPFAFANALENEFAGAAVFQMCQNSGSRHIGVTSFTAPDRVGTAAVNTAGADATIIGVGPSAPFTWAAGDFFVFAGRYRMATKYL